MTEGGSFAALLRGHRAARRLSQEELAHEAGLSVRAIRNAELGRVRCPRRDSVERLADALRLAPEARRELTDAARAQRVLPTRHPRRPGSARYRYRLRPGTDVVLVIRLSVAGQGEGEWNQVLASITACGHPVGHPWPDEWSVSVFRRRLAELRTAHARKASLLERLGRLDSTTESARAT
jgi:transcriptional regulator with XRE-family HTH domain